MEEKDIIYNKNKVFNQIAEGLASHYDVIYYIDYNTGAYVELISNSIYGNLEVMEEGKDFFTEAIANAQLLVHKDDKDGVLEALSRSYLINALRSRKHFSYDYRLIVDGQIQHTRLTVMWSSDMSHIVIGVENVEEEARKETAQQQALQSANEMARRDALTGAKNKNAYQEYEKSVQDALDDKSDERPFAIVVCDLNDLKLVNDTIGHKAGDEYIQSSCKMIFDTFSHSPVFRIGGDEFVAFLRGRDYFDREGLFGSLRERIIANQNKGKGAVIATGIAVYNPEKDVKVSEVFDRADAMMYENKQSLKESKKIRGGFMDAPQMNDVIPEERKKKLDSLFEAISVAAEGTYVYLCDMKYDYSRWSKTAVDAFRLPSEYMYGAGDIWEERIHPEDRDAYHKSIDAIFSGADSGHEMQYRARKVSGEYDICTCKGIVIRDNRTNEPEYFGGTIRNHGIQGHADHLTGLRNQYGFFEDLQSNIINNTSMIVCMVGINKFSDINELYGYQFGNSVLQNFGKIFIEHVGNAGYAYRLDGVKFAVLTSRQTKDEIEKNYEDLRSFFRSNFSVDDKYVNLELNAGMIEVNNFDADSQTVYSCLNYAYGESRVKKQGDLVEFNNSPDNADQHGIEQLHTIRASMTQNYKGFYLLYQPVVDAEKEVLSGAEALIRWENEEYGMVPPDLFVPVLEKDPLFPGLGQWILETAVRDAKKLLKSHPDFVMNVNLSYTQLEKPDFAHMVISVLENADFPPEHLCLEITERCRLLDMELLKNIIEALRAKGVLIALDDFGTGFSSVVLVKNIPFDVIKIDRSFVLRIEEDNKEREIIRHFAGVASTFGAKVSVEGIETAGMRDILQRYGVQSFQGYYYAKPFRLEDLISWKPE